LSGSESEKNLAFFEFSEDFRLTTWLFFDNLPIRRRMNTCYKRNWLIAWGYRLRSEQSAVQDWAELGLRG